MRNFETSGLLCCGRNKESLCLSFGASGWALALGLGLGLGFGLVIPQVAQAACVSTPDCESLGYTETSCVSGGVKCPWDTSKMFCGCGAAYVYSCTGSNETGGVGEPCGEKYASCNCATNYEWSNDACVCNSTFQYTCTGTGYSGGVGGACGGKYASCTCASGYEWNGSACACDNSCSVGNILYSDKTCSSCNISGKTPIGVVSYVNGSTRIAIQLDDPGEMYWSSEHTDISGIPNYTDNSTALNDFNGKSNTQAWVYYWGAGVTSYAPGYCNAYSKGGVRGWYLPAPGELYASFMTNKTAVNAGLSKAGGTAIVEDYHWSSSEYASHYVWCVHANGGMGYTTRLNLCYVRCVLAF